VSYKKLGKRIQRAREEAGLNQEQLAGILGCSQPTLSNYEKGKSRIYLAQLQKVADALNKPITYFLEAMEPAEAEMQIPRPNEDPATDPDSVLINVDKEILEIIRVLYSLPAENRKAVREFVLWEQHRVRREKDNG
jgi:transcriptional regulator with XRE-family HTH domain